MLLYLVKRGDNFYFMDALSMLLFSCIDRPRISCD